MKVELDKEIQRSKKSALIGVIVMIVGAILIFVGVKSLAAHNSWVKAAESQYEQEYNEWQENWWNHDANLSDMPKRPNTMPPVGQILLIFGGAVAAFIGLGMVISGKATSSFLNSAEENKELLNGLDEEPLEDESIMKKNTTGKKKTKCENCGATIKGNTCEYCGQ